jgi:hypothetical protein
MEKPELESINVEEVKNELDSVTEETTKEELYRKIDFFVKQLNMAHDQNRRNMLVMTEALEVAQSKYKKLEASKQPWKLLIKKILIGWGWYEASYEELKEIHFGR